MLLEAVRASRLAQRQRGGPGPTTRLFALHNLPDSATAVSRRMASDESIDAFTARVRGLEQEEQKLVLHCGLEGLPYKDVAQRMELSTDAVAKRWQRLRARLVQLGLPQHLLALIPTATVVVAAARCRTREPCIRAQERTKHDS